MDHTEMDQIGRAWPASGGPGRWERGAAAVEYALLVMLVAVAIVGSVLAFGLQVKALFEVPWPS